MVMLVGILLLAGCSSGATASLSAEAALRSATGATGDGTVSPSPPPTVEASQTPATPTTATRTDGVVTPRPAVTSPGTSHRAARTTPRRSGAVARGAVAPKPSADPTTAGVLAYGPATETAPEGQVVQLVNEQRVAAGCQPVAVNATLVTLARAHSLEMSTIVDGVKHNSLDGRTPFDRMIAAGYTYAMAAENVAGGQTTAAAVMTAWMNSSDHKANIVNCALTQVGVGMYYRAGSQYGTYWTQDFASPM
jgi:uncharacterized protein YkwD